MLERWQFIFSPPSICNGILLILSFNRYFMIRLCVLQFSDSLAEQYFGNRIQHEKQGKLIKGKSGPQSIEAYSIVPGYYFIAAIPSWNPTD
jgi:hypothetical protein